MKGMNLTKGRDEDEEVMWEIWYAVTSCRMVFVLNFIKDVEDDGSLEARPDYDKVGAPIQIIHDDLGVI